VVKSERIPYFKVFLLFFCNTKLTAKWEMQLTEIAKGNQEPEVFMQGIERMVAELVNTYHEVGEEAVLLMADEEELVSRAAATRANKK